MTTTYTPNLRLPIPDFRTSPWHTQLVDSLMAIDASIYSALLANQVTNWDNSTNYVVGDTIVDPDNGSLWLCQVAHESDASPTTFSEDRIANPTYWGPIALGLQTRGEWANDVTYYYNDIAYDSVEGIFAICTIEHVSNGAGTLTDDIAYWDFIFEFTAVTAATGITYDGTTSGLAATNVQTAIDEVVADFGTALNLKANLASPTFSGTVTITTVAGSTDNTDKAASTSFVQAVAAALINSAPSNLNTLAEIAASINNDAAYSTTVNTALALKAPLASPAFTGNPTAATQTALNASTRLATTAYVDSAVTVGGVPIGGIVLFATNTAPSGYVELNGGIHSRATYPALWAHANASGNIVAEASWGANYGAFSTGDTSTTFRVPLIAGMFVRGWDHGVGVDAGRAIGSYQADAFLSHSHPFTDNDASGSFNPPAGTDSPTTLPQPSSTANSTSAVGGSETRPKNVALMYCMRAF